MNVVFLEWLSSEIFCLDLQNLTKYKNCFVVFGGSFCTPHTRQEEFGPGYATFCGILYPGTKLTFEGTKHFPHFITKEVRNIKKKHFV